MEMKPFAIFMVRGIDNNKEIYTKGWGHLLMSGKLPMLPSIVIKASDLVIHAPGHANKDTKIASKKQFRVYLCPTMGVKRAQLAALNIRKVVLLTPEDEELSKYKREQLDGISNCEIVSMSSELQNYINAIKSDPKN